MKIQTNGTDITPILSDTQEILEFIGSPPTGGLSEQLSEHDAHLFITYAAVGGVDHAVAAVKLDTEDILDVLGPTGPVQGAIADVFQEAENIEHHIHNVDRWMCQAVSVNGEIHVADKMSLVVSPNTATPFRLTSGNNNWGLWVQLLGSTDTPILDGMTKFDPATDYIVNVSHAATVFLIQFAWGTSGAAALSAGTFTETLYSSGQTVQGSDGANIIRAPRINAGTKYWARCLTPGNNARWVDIFIDIHEYLT